MTRLTALALTAALASSPALAQEGNQRVSRELAQCRAQRSALIADRQNLLAEIDALTVSLDVCYDDQALLDAQITALTASLAQCEAPVVLSPGTGGFVASDDGGASLLMPPGAVDAPTAITIRANLTVTFENTTALSPAYDFDGNGITQFEEPLTLCLRTDSPPDEGPEGKCLGYLDTSESPPSWKCEDSCLAKPIANDGLLCGETDHFTSFAILLTGSDDKSGCDEDDGYLIPKTGGTVSTPGGDALVSVPPAALRTPATLTVAPAAPPANDVDRLSPVFAMGPAGATFREPVTVCLAVDPTRVPEATAPCLGYVDTSGRLPTWVCEDPCVTRTDDNVFCGKTDHFTNFAILLGGGLTEAECAAR